MRALITIVFSLCAFCAAAADTFRWQDANGHIHYSDEPPEDARQLRRVKTYECETAQCKADMQQRYDDAVAANQALEEWLRQRDAERRAQQTAARQAPSHPVYIGTSIVYPGVPVVAPLFRDPYYRQPPHHSRPRHHRESHRRLRTRYQVRR